METKRAQAGTIATLLVLFGSFVVVGAVLSNSTNESTENITIPLISGFSVLENSSIESNTSPLETNETQVTEIVSDVTNSTDSSPIGQEPTENATIPSVEENEAEISENSVLNETFANESFDLQVIENINTSITNETILADNATENVTTSLNLSFENETNKVELAKLLNEDNLDFDRYYKERYLNERNNFSDISYKEVLDLEKAELHVGAENDKIRGFEIDKKRYAVDLLGCNSYERYCTFRINGVPTKKLFSSSDSEDLKNSFELDSEFEMKIDSIEFDYCNGKRFCHLGYEGYHKVDISVERKG